jgi:hypothetical protein
MEKRELTADEIQDVLKQLEAYLADLKARWDQENPVNTSWLGIGRSYILQCTTYLIGVIDELVQFVEELIPAGEDKKAAVMALVGKLFDYIVVQAFPFWLKPFAGTIKGVIVNVIISNLIDFIVGKYNAGAWKMETNG